MISIDNQIKYMKTLCRIQRIITKDPDETAEAVLNSLKVQKAYMASNVSDGILIYVTQDQLKKIDKILHPVSED